TWALRGHTPVARVSGSSGRLPVAGMACLKAGRAGRFFCRVHLLPGYAPGRNAVEGAWASMKSSLGNHAARTLEELGQWPAPVSVASSDAPASLTHSRARPVSPSNPSWPRRLDLAPPGRLDLAPPGLGRVTESLCRLEVARRAGC